MPCDAKQRKLSRISANPKLKTLTNVCQMHGPQKTSFWSRLEKFHIYSEDLYGIFGENPTFSSIFRRKSQYLLSRIAKFSPAALFRVNNSLEYLIMTYMFEKKSPRSGEIFWELNRREAAKNFAVFFGFIK